MALLEEFQPKTKISPHSPPILDFFPGVFLLFLYVPSLCSFFSLKRGLASASLICFGGFTALKELILPRPLYDPCDFCRVLAGALVVMDIPAVLGGLCQNLGGLRPEWQGPLWMHGCFAAPAVFNSSHGAAFCTGCRASSGFFRAAMLGKGQDLGSQARTQWPMASSPPARQPLGPGLALLGRVGRGGVGLAWGASHYLFKARRERESFAGLFGLKCECHKGVFSSFIGLSACLFFKGSQQLFFAGHGGNS